MTARYVHVEVRQLLRGASDSHAEAECAVTLPTGETTTVFAKLRSDRAPYWRVVSLEEFGNALLALAFEAVGEEEICSRIAVAAAQWNLMDAIDALRQKDVL